MELRTSEEILQMVDERKGKKLTEKMIGPHNEGRFPQKNYIEEV